MDARGTEIKLIFLCSSEVRLIKKSLTFDTEYITTANLNETICRTEEGKDKVK